MTYEIWKEQHFTAEDRLNIMISGDTADFDGDGLNTILEYALGLDPKFQDAASGHAAILVEDGGNDYLAMTMRKQKNTIDLTYHVEVADGLEGWSTATVQLGAATDNGDTTETVTIRDTQNIVVGDKRFIRVRVLLSE
jgi:hypothetical protein